MLCDLAAQALGAIVYGIYPTAAPAEIEYQMQDGGAAIFVAEDQEYVDKLLAFADRLPNLRWIVVVDSTAMFGYAHPKLRRYDELLAGEDLPDERAIVFLEERVPPIQPRDPAFIVYTSGTTGHPKGAVIAHGRHLAAAHTFVEHYPELAREHRTVVHLPLCHILGRDLAITLPLIGGLVPHFGEDLEDLAATLFEVAPTMLFTVPRYLQKFASTVLVAVNNSSPVKRAVFAWAMKVGREQARRRWEGRGESPGETQGESLAYAAARALVFKPILNKLGFDQLRLFLSGGAPVAPETMALWQIWGINLLEVYGQTEEAGALVTAQIGPYSRPGDVGVPARGWDLRFAGEDPNRGEILIRASISSRATGATSRRHARLSTPTGGCIPATWESAHPRARSGSSTARGTSS